MGVAYVCHGSQTLCIMQRAEQQQAVRERNASARRVVRAAQSVEQQHAVRERNASARRAARAA